MPAETARPPSPEEELRALIASRHAIVVSDTRDESGLVGCAKSAAARLGRAVWRWTPADGLSTIDGPQQSGTKDPAAAVAFLRELRRPAVALLLDAAPMLADPAAARGLKELGAGVCDITAIITGVGAGIPDSLDGAAVAWSPRPPDRAQMRELVERIVRDLPRHGWQVRISDIDPLVEAVMGLTPDEVERVILLHTAVDGALTGADAAAAQQTRAELLSDGPLDLIDPGTTFADVAGLDALKEWLRVRGRGFEPEAREFGLDPPRGILLVGVPGCGKSLLARAIAGTWAMSLASLDAANLHGSYIGESEKRLRDALRAAEAMSPTVLWIDEIEKAFAGSGDADGGASRRVMGVLLRWLQEHTAAVFVVATCNDVVSLPAELTRRGRFDEIFFVDLPDALERTAIITHHLHRRRQDSERFNLDALATAAAGFSGAEIESAITAALYSAFAANTPLSDGVLIAEFQRTIPLSVTRAEDVAALRGWARGRARCAGGYPPPGATTTR